MTPARSRAFAVDLAIYIAVMFLVREIYYERIGFIANGLIWSLSTLAIASWRMKVRGVTWRELGLCKPQSYKKALIATGVILALVPITMIAFELIKDQVPALSPDGSEAAAVSRFGNLAGNWTLFLTIIPFIWVESFLEEILDRGFLMNWIERLFSKSWLATALAVILQAAIFGFRHSYDLSARSITVGIIGLVMGIGYVAFGRNLWPLVVAHCVLNTMSMMRKVV